ncbi:MAG: glycosyltransferase, partial [Parachlamydiaceae bacterium]|nr:glycosyltransferase [Parachlamydiaceae bacterium]
LSLILFSDLNAYDVTIVGPVGHADGLARISVGVIDLLKDDLKINCIPTVVKLKDIENDVKKIVLNPDKFAGAVTFFSSALWYASHPLLSQKVPNSKIKIAYSMLESTCIPPEWVEILNSQFDAVAVPDKFLIAVYENSGVNIPIFELPLGMYLDDFSLKKKRKRPSNPFVFGTTVSCDERKNYALMIQSFAEEFGNQKGVVLKLNSRQGNSNMYKELIKTLGVSNIIFTHKVLDKKNYIKFIDSFDCFINISKGEGFSLCPREALALGIPCVLTENSSQITICNSGLVRAVPSTILEPTDYWGLFGGQQVGFFSNCTKEDVKIALRDVYTNYSSYLNKAKAGPKWTSQYRWINLKKKYLNLIKPKKVYLGDSNVITDEYLMTNSTNLYEKYIELISDPKNKID